MKIWEKTIFAFLLIILIVGTAVTINSGSNAFDSLKPLKSDTSGFYQRKILYSSLIYKYDTFIRQSFQKENLPGLAYAIVKDNQILLIKTYGVKEFGKTDSINQNTVFRLGSVSKGFASVLTGILVDEHKLSWDDQVIKYLPDFTLKDSAFTSQLTVRNILSQTSGLPTHTYTDMLDCNVPYDQIKPMLANVPPMCAPGKLYSYQNVAYSLIGDIVKSATGEDYKTLVTNKIFTPLYMQDASLDFETISSDTNVAMPHVYAGNHMWSSQKLNSRYYTVLPASGVNASISDMSKWLLGLLGNYPEFIPEKSLEEVYTPQIPTPIKRRFRYHWKNLGKLYYGLGWRVFDVNSDEIIYHGGYVKGYRAEIALDYKQKVGIAVLFNANCHLSNTCIPTFWEYYFEDFNNLFAVALK